MAKGEATLLLKIKEVGGSILDKFVFTLSDVSAAISVVTDYVGKAIDQFKEQEKAVNMLNQSMINAGTYTAELQNQYLAQAAALQKVTLFTDDQINSSQALLQASIGNRIVTDDLMKATLDLAQAKGMDLASASNLVGKAIAGEAEILKRYGIELDLSSANGDKLVAVTEALSAKFGGQAEAARQGTGGIDGFKISMDELAESIGSQLAPRIAKLAELMIPLIDKITGWIEGGDLAKKTVNELSNEMVTLQNKIISLLAEKDTTQVVGALARINTQIDVNIAKMSELQIALDKQIADEALARENAAANDQVRRDNELVKTQEQYLKKQEMALTYDQLQADLLLAQQEGNAVKVAELELRILETKYKNLTDFEAKKKALTDIAAAQDTAQKIKKAEAERKFEETVQRQRLQGYSTFFNGVASLSQSSNAQLASIGKAAAISQATIDAYLAIQNALSSVPYPANIAAAAGIGIQAFANVSKIAGVPLAEGGIVQPRAGGIQATIGEAGQAEAVIPLDRADEFGLGGGSKGVTIIVYGGLLGDERSAQEFASAVDKELLKLRQNGGSVAFDTVV